MASYTALHRARRQSQASPVLTAIFELMFEEPVGALLVQAAADGRPPAAAISSILIERLGREAFAGDQTRQHVGLCIAARLEGLGWVVDGTRTRLTGDPLFQTASLFKRAPTLPRSSAHDLLERLVSALDENEASILADLLEARRKGGAPVSRPALSAGTDRREHTEPSRGRHDD